MRVLSSLTIKDQTRGAEKTCSTAARRIATWNMNRCSRRVENILRAGEVAGLGVHDLITLLDAE